MGKRLARPTTPTDVLDSAPVSCDTTSESAPGPWGVDGRDAVACARARGLPDYERALLEMADAKQGHEAFFLRTVATHPWLPTLRRLFGWG